MARPNLSSLISKFIFRETLSTQDKTDIRADIGAQPLNSNLTDYANAANATARRVFVEAAPTIEILGYADILQPPISGEVGALRIMSNVEPGQQLCYWTGTEWVSATTGVQPQAY